MINNEATFTSDELIVLFGENNCYNFGDLTEIKGVSTDSRNIEPGNLFVALKGENFDGNTKSAIALESGARAALISDEYYLSHETELKGRSLIVVKDTVAALGKLARYHRNRFDFPVFMIAGSNGKTTTKDMVAEVLGTNYNIIRTEGNLNNQIGVPLTLFMLNQSHELAVIECGTNEPGEIAILSSIVQPTHGLITNIGREHLEKLIDLDGVEMEETFLYGFLKKHAGLGLINFDDTRLRRYSSLLDKKFIYGNSSDCDLIADVEIKDDLKTTVNFKYQNVEYQANLNTTGLASGYNAIAAIAAGLVFELSPVKIIEALEKFTPDEEHEYARMVKQEINGVIVLNDCYNANPDSMRMSLDTLAAYKTSNTKFAVLGDMLELGESSAEEHASLLEYASKKADQILLFGPQMHSAAGSITGSKIHSYPNKTKLAEELKRKVKAGDVILLKGSRGMRMETILEDLKR